MLSLLFSSPIYFFITAISLILALTIHEFCHALVADHLGDPTPRANGRLTLNPLAHLDPIGTLLLFIAGFGWGKPVPVDAYNFQSPRKDTALVSLAGPASNFLFALTLSLISKLFLPQEYSLLLYPAITISLALAVFNLIPVYPLDGEKILTGLLPTDMAYEYELVMHRYGTIILILLLLPLFNGTTPVSAIIYPIIDLLTKLLI